MTRRILALAMVTAALLGGCARPGAQPAVVLPTTAALVAEWEEAGGFVAPGSLQIRAPRLAVYADGTAIADADRTLRLTADEVTTLVGDLRQGLAGLPTEVVSDQGMQVADATSTVLRVLLADGSTQSVSAYALTIQDGYPDKLVAQAAKVESLFERINRDGTDYTAERVRVVAQPRDDLKLAPAWPATVPLPAPAADPYGAQVFELVSINATAVRAAWPDSVIRGRGWPTAQLPDGTVVGVGWRYLLPHEG